MLLILVIACFFCYVFDVISGMSYGLILIGIAFCMLLFRAIETRLKYTPGHHLRHFTKLENTGTFLETMPKFHDNRPKAAQATLLLHGFSASTSEFKHLYPELDAAGILYFAPSLSGFGNESPKELQAVTAEQWIRDAERAYALVSGMAEKVNIIAHSMGAMLALYLAGKYPVEHLVLTSPYLEPLQGHKFFKKLLQVPVLSQIFMFANPVVTKSSLADLEKVAQSGRFVYSSVPVQAIYSLWKLTGYIPYARVAAKTSALLLGERDNTIDLERTVARLLEVFPTIKIKRYARSGHNLLEDVESERVIDEVLRGLVK